MGHEKTTRTDREWRERLTPQQYAVTREGATDPPFSGRYVHPGATGVFHCVCCEADLFATDDQFDSGSGWPSFTQPATADRVCVTPDRSHGMTRTEVRCASCDAHLGHVFDDGPAPTGQRYCLNSTALRLVSTA